MWSWKRSRSSGKARGARCHLHSAKHDIIKRRSQFKCYIEHSVRFSVCSGTGPHSFAFSCQSLFPTDGVIAAPTPPSPFPGFFGPLPTPAVAK